MRLAKASPAAAAFASGAHPAVYIAVWMSLSSSVILFNKYILFEGGFPFPIFLTTWHLIFATIATRVLHRTTNLLAGLDNVQLSRKTYWRAIVPIGALFSASLIFSNLAYLHLSVSFIQMLKATTPVAVLLLGWALGNEKPNMTVLYKVLVIVAGIALASYGEINFILTGVICQGLGIIFEAARLVMVQKLLHQYKMDPLCSLYHFAPVCAVMNGIACVIFEGSLLNVESFATIGTSVLLANACVAFLLNCAVVFLIGKTSSLVMCLAGIAKDIILVAVSSILWETPIGSCQLIGYGIALAGMVWYTNLSIFSKPGYSSVQRTRKIAVIAASGVLILTTLSFLGAIDDGTSSSVPSAALHPTTASASSSSGPAGFKAELSESSSFTVDAANAVEKTLSRTPVAKDSALALQEPANGKATRPPPTPIVNSKSKPILSQPFERCLLSDTKNGPPRMVVVAQHGEDSEWLPAVRASPVIVYEKLGTNRSAEHVVPNYGNEASTFIKFILDNYDCLPNKTVFVHGHRTSWHTPEPMDEILNKMSWDRAEFFKMPASDRGATDVARYPPDRSVEESVPVELHIFWNRWFKKKYGPVPERVEAQCCAQFVVSRHRVRLNSWSWYKEIYDWLISEEVPSYWSGRALEYSWHVMFGENPVEPIWNW
ncbi:hypothetical protein HDU88_002340 [Geranomyces variabilis]|nr:hypothetical protein HDU88_002340 [Geranomyces variabilis]